MSELSDSCLAPSNSATPWTVAHQAPLIMGLSRQEYWSVLPFPPPGHRYHRVIQTRLVQKNMTLLFDSSGGQRFKVKVLAGLCSFWRLQKNSSSCLSSFIELHKPLHHDKVVIHEGGNVKDRGVCRATVHGVAKS